MSIPRSKHGGTRKMKGKEVKLEIMDWKNVERESENAIRVAMIATDIHEMARQKAKIEIIKLGGKISEEENDTTSKDDATTNPIV